MNPKGPVKPKPGVGAEWYAHSLPASLNSSHLPPPTTSNKIMFYDWQDPYFEFTNFYRCSVKIDGKIWPTTEHYFQAQKFIGTPYEEHVRKLTTPREAFMFSREPTVQCWIRKDWQQVKDDVMKLALLHKFEQHDALRQKLVSTGDKELVEHTSNDSYWGDGGDGTGKNKLGCLLMEVRGIMRSKHGVAQHRIPQHGGDWSRPSATPARTLRRSQSLENVSVRSISTATKHHSYAAAVQLPKNKSSTTSRNTNQTNSSFHNLSFR